MIKSDLKSYKDSRRQFEKMLDKYETHLNRYNVLSKQKEASALREDAFQMYELRKLYIRNSSDHFTKLVSFKANLEILLIECFSGALSSQIEEIDESAYTCSSARSKVAGWKQWLDESKMTTRYQLSKIENRCTELQELYIAQLKPHRSLKSYSTTSNDQMLAVSSSSVGKSVHAPIPSFTQASNPSLINVRTTSKSKQGYLNSRIMIGKTRPPWVRRWFFLQDGWFGTCTVSTVNREKGCIVLGDRIRISKCIFRVCADLDRRYCFEVTHPDCNFFLQAETEEEMQQWLWSIEDNIEEHKKALLSSSSPSSISSSLSTTDLPQLLLSPKALITDRLHTATSLTVEKKDSPPLVAMSTSPLPSPDGSEQKSLTPILSTTTAPLTTLMIREATHLDNRNLAGADTKQQNNQDIMPSTKGAYSSSAWNMPWLTTGINAFSTSDEDMLQQGSQDNNSNNNDPTQFIVWPNKLEMDVPIPQILHYSAYLEIAQKELRKFFYNVPKDEIVIESKYACVDSDAYFRILKG